VFSATASQEQNK
jgi:hypothetical protein